MEKEDIENTNIGRTSGNVAAKCDTNLSALADSMQFLTLGTPGISNQRKFNVNSWSTPLRSIENHLCRPNRAKNNFRSPNIGSNIGDFGLNEVGNTYDDDGLNNVSDLLPSDNIFEKTSDLIEYCLEFQGEPNYIKSLDETASMTPHEHSHLSHTATMNMSGPNSSSNSAGGLTAKEPSDFSKLLSSCVDQPLVDAECSLSQENVVDGTGLSSFCEKVSLPIFSSTLKSFELCAVQSSSLEFLPSKFERTSVSGLSGSSLEMSVRNNLQSSIIDESRVNSSKLLPFQIVNKNDIGPSENWTVVENSEPTSDEPTQSNLFGAPTEVELGSCTNDSTRSDRFCIRPNFERRDEKNISTSLVRYVESNGASNQNISMKCSSDIIAQYIGTVTEVCLSKTNVAAETSTEFEKSIEFSQYSNSVAENDTSICEQSPLKFERVEWERKFCGDVEQVGQPEIWRTSSERSLLPNPEETESSDIEFLSNSSFDGLSSAEYEEVTALKRDLVCVKRISTSEDILDSLACVSPALKLTKTAYSESFWTRRGEMTFEINDLSNVSLSLESVRRNALRECANISEPNSYVIANVKLNGERDEAFLVQNETSVGFSSDDLSSISLLEKTVGYQNSSKHDVISRNSVFSENEKTVVSSVGAFGHKVEIPEVENFCSPVIVLSSAEYDKTKSKGSSNLSELAKPLIEQSISDDTASVLSSLESEETGISEKPPESDIVESDWKSEIVDVVPEATEGYREGNLCLPQNMSLSLSDVPTLVEPGVDCLRLSTLWEVSPSSRSADFRAGSSGRCSGEWSTDNVSGFLETARRTNVERNNEEASGSQFKFSSEQINSSLSKSSEVCDDTVYLDNYQIHSSFVEDICKIVKSNFVSSSSNAFCSDNVDSGNVSDSESTAQASNLAPDNPKSLYIEETGQADAEEKLTPTASSRRSFEMRPSKTFFDVEEDSDVFVNSVGARKSDFSATKLKSLDNRMDSSDGERTNSPKKIGKYSTDISTKIPNGTNSHQSHFENDEILGAVSTNCVRLTDAFLNDNVSEVLPDALFDAEERNSVRSDDCFEDCAESQCSSFPTDENVTVEGRPETPQSRSSDGDHSFVSISCDRVLESEQHHYSVECPVENDYPNSSGEVSPNDVSTEITVIVSSSAHDGSTKSFGHSSQTSPSAVSALGDSLSLEKTDEPVEGEIGSQTGRSRIAVDADVRETCLPQSTSEKSNSSPHRTPTRRTDGNGAWGREDTQCERLVRVCDSVNKLVLLCTPMKDERIQLGTPVNPFRCEKMGNDGRKIIFDFPTNLLDVSIGMLESMTAMMAPTKYAVEKLGDANQNIVSDLLSVAAQTPKTIPGQSELPDSFASCNVGSELPDVFVINMRLLEENENLKSDLEQYKRKYDVLREEYESLLKTACALRTNETTLKKALQEYEDETRKANNKYEILKEYANTLVVGLNRSLDRCEKELINKNEELRKLKNSS